jgi:hypothetical protein
MDFIGDEGALRELYWSLVSCHFSIGDKSPMINDQ